MKLLHIANVVSRLPDHSRLSDYHEGLRDLVAVHSATGLLENGGFTFWLECGPRDSSDLYAVAEAFGNLGFPQIVTAIKSVLDLFPNAIIPAESDQRLAHLSALGEEGDRVMDEAERIIFPLTDAITDACYDECLRKASLLKKYEILG